MLDVTAVRTNVPEWPMSLTDDYERRRGYLGSLPYLLVLRWCTFLGMAIRVGMHQFSQTSDQNFFQGTVAWAAGTVLAIALTVLRRKHVSELVGLTCVYLDILIFSVAYVSTRRIESDFFLFYFLPLITAAEYLRLRQVAVVFVALTAAFGTVLFILYSTGSAPGMTLTEIFFRVFLGREFFFLGMVVTACHLFKLDEVRYDKIRQTHLELIETVKRERQQGRELRETHEKLMETVSRERQQAQDLKQARNQLQALFDFSTNTQEVFAIEDLLRCAISIVVNTLGTDGVIAVCLDSEGSVKVELYARPGNMAEISMRAECWKGVVAGHSPRPAEGASWRSEILDFGTLRIGVLEVHAPDGGGLPAGAEEFLSALKGPLLLSLRRAQILPSLRRINGETLRTLDFDRQLNAILAEATENLGMEFAAVTLADEYRGIVETVRGRNVPPGLLRLSRYKQADPDVQTLVIATGRTLAYVGAEFCGLGSDPGPQLFNPVIFQRFEHDKVARVWVPILDGDRIIGTLEAGGNREDKESLLGADRIRELEELGRRCGPELARVQPNELLRMIASHAIRLVNADSASIHVFQSEAPLHVEQLAAIATAEELATFFQSETPLLAAGAGRADARFIIEHQPRPGGIGWNAVLSFLRKDGRSGYQALAEEELKRDKPDLYALGMRAILAVPLHVAPNVVGVLYIHRWAEDSGELQCEEYSHHSLKFSEQDIQLERVFAAQIEVAIQSHLLLTTTARDVEDFRTLLGWLKVIQSPELGDVAEVLQELAQKVLLVADADNVVLYPYAAEADEFVTPLILRGEFKDAGAMRREVEPDHIARSLLTGLPQFHEDIAAECPSFVRPRGDKRRFIDREEIASASIVPLRAGSGGDGEIFGLLFINYRKRRRFTQELRNTLVTLAASAATVIRTARYYHAQNKRKEYLRSLSAVDQAIVKGAAGMTVDRVLSSVLTEAIAISKAPVGAVLKRIGEELQVAVAFPVMDTAPYSLLEKSFPVDTGILGNAFATGDMLITLRHTESNPAPLVPAHSRSSVIIPLADRHHTMGLLVLESDRPAFFSREDLTALNSLAVHGAVALPAIDNYRKLEEERRRAVALSRIATRIQKHSIDHAQHLILTGITAGESLGFSRAMLFLKDERGALQGRCGIGPINGREASKVWIQIVTDSDNATEQIVDGVLDRAAEYFERVCQAGNDKFFSAICGMRIPLDGVGGAISECLQLGSGPRRVQPGEPDPFRSIIARATGVHDEGTPFVCVPLHGTNEVIGVLVVDNRFLTTKENAPIDEHLTEMLSAYAELAAMSIERARLLELVQTRTYEDLAHQIRQPIFLATHYSEDLLKRPPNDPKQHRKLLKLNALVKRSVRVSNSLQHYANLARERELAITKQRIRLRQLRSAIGDSVEDFKVLYDARLEDHKLAVCVLEPGFERSESVQVDLGLFREAFDLLLDNAAWYSDDNTQIQVAAEMAGDSLVDIVVRNRGIPITRGDLERIAKRNWRSEQAQSVRADGSGIGLFVASKIMKAHGGLLVPSPTIDGVTRMALRFPVQRGS